MEDVLKKLLDAEVQAEALVSEAETRHKQVVQQALDAARAAELEHGKQIPALRQTQADKAEARAQQTLVELKRRYEERQRELHVLAEKSAAAALEAAAKLVLDPDEA